MHACTIVARNYLGFARVLAESFSRLHPDGSFSTLVVDAEFGLRPVDEPFTVVTPDQLDLTGQEFHRMAVMYDVTELATALKPWLLRYLIDSGADTAIYIDPDIRMFNPIDDVATMVAEHGIALTPHSLSPMPRDTLLPSEADIMGSGAYNLGFIAVGRAAVPFLRWWEERLIRDAISAPELMLFTDQRWIDLVPSYFGHHIIRDPGFNVAYWNLDDRVVTKVGDGYLVNGVPLRFFHFSGYRPETPWILSKYVACAPRILLSEQPVIRELCQDYGNLLGAASFDSAAAVPYGFSRLADETVLTPRIRRIYRDAVVSHDKGLAPPPPPAFGDDCSNGALIDWLNEPVAGPGHAPLTRFMADLWDRRTDLQWVYPDPAGASWEAFCQWMRERAPMEEAAPERLLPPLRTVGEEPDGPAPVPGVNLVGYLRAELGVGQISRQLLAAVKAADIPFSVYSHDRTLSRQQHELDEIESAAFEHDVNILTVNADQTPAFLRDAPVDLRRNRQTIGVWAWEVEELPHSTFQAFPCVDEIWALSHFMKDALDRHSPVPVHVVPLPVVKPQVDPAVTRASLGLPEGFLFLFVFDHLSVLARKNPIGVIDAFTAAFAPGEGPTLVIKSINGDRCRTDRERVRFAARGRDDIVLMEDYLPAGRTTALMALCDCYVSLHRSEGYGLTMADAMALGRPVIATGYSGNLDFMDQTTALLVPYEEVPVGPGADPYPATAVWAEPDLRAAAAYLRKVYEEPDFAAELGRSGQRHVLERHSLRATSDFVLERVEDARGRMSRQPEAASAREVTEAVEAPEARPARTPHEAFKAAVEAASQQLGSSADPDAPTRFRTVVPAVRRALNRLLQHHDQHERLALAAVLDSVKALSHDDQMSALHLSRLIADQQVRGEQLQERVDRQMRAARNDTENTHVRQRAINEQVARLERHLRSIELRLDEISTLGEQTAEAVRDSGRSSAASAQELTGFLQRAATDLSGDVSALRREAAETRSSLQDAVGLLALAALPDLNLPPASVVSTDVGLLLLPKDDTVVLPWLRFYGSWEPEESAFLRATLKPGDTFLDVGAHVGYHTVAAAPLVGPSGRVVAIEPSPQMAALLEANLRLTVAPELAAVVEVVRVAAWDEDTMVNLAQSLDGNSGDSRVYSGTGDQRIPVEAARLDGLAAVSGSTVSIVKTDLQGRDHRALAGLRKTLERDRPLIVTEFWPAGIRDGGDDPLDVLAQYTAMGYDRQSLPGQPPLPEQPTEVEAVARAADGGFITLVLTPAASLHP